MVNTAAVARIGSLLGDPARANMMIALLDGHEWMASELAMVAGISAQTASTHLAKLTDANMITVEKRGRERYHRLSSSDVARLVEQMHVIGAAIPARSPNAGPRDGALRELRSCYDHLAGRIAVDVSARLIEDASAETTRLKPEAFPLLERLGIEFDKLAQGRRVVCRTCLDWSEKKPHMAGALGAALLERFDALSWVKRQASTRALVLTATGERGLSDVFGVSSVRTGARQRQH
ncbi:MAG TPA: metalloregulator ArsR/SmtB family transcription factor [Sphingomicrobium sp.]|nr:metalloregulator ArsR/SmtB family transcription factor [Sphingomicrobium sp.]